MNLTRIYIERGVPGGVGELALDKSAVSNGVEMVCWGMFCEEDEMLANPWRIRRNLSS